METHQGASMVRLPRTLKFFSPLSLVFLLSFNSQIFAAAPQIPNAPRPLPARGNNNAAQRLPALGPVAINPDTDNDGIKLGFDNCPNIANADQLDADGDRVGDACDNCPGFVSSNRNDTDRDGQGDACDLDDDNDAKNDDRDNCPLAANANQFDGDNDGFGDVCDNCPHWHARDQSDADDDGIGNLCDDGDFDGDGVADRNDNCISVANPLNADNEQADQDRDLQGDACDLDKDGDGFNNEQDNCPNLFYQPPRGGPQALPDTDNDGIGDVCDPSPNGDAPAENPGEAVPPPPAERPPVQGEPAAPPAQGGGEDAAAPGAGEDSRAPIPNEPAPPGQDAGNQADAPNNQQVGGVEVGLQAAVDSDHDEVADAEDNCPALANKNQSNIDSDAMGDACDDDDDGDGIADANDNCPVNVNADQKDSDQDKLGDICDAEPNTAFSPQQNLKSGDHGTCSLNVQTPASAWLAYCFAAALLGLFVRKKHF